MTDSNRSAKSVTSLPVDPYPGLQSFREQEAVKARNVAQTEKRAADQERDKADQNQTTVARTNAHHYWLFAVRERDRHQPNTNNLLADSHLFLRGSQSIQSISPQQMTNGIKS
jgi:hypothetical protein